MSKRSGGIIGCKYIITDNQHQVNPEFLGSRNCVPMAYSGDPMAPLMCASLFLLTPTRLELDY